MDDVEIGPGGAGGPWLGVGVDPLAALERPVAWKPDPRWEADIAALCERFNRHLDEVLTSGQAGMVKRCPTRWGRVFQAILARDGYSCDQVLAVIEWVGRDPFWVQNVRTPEKLRKHLDRLSLNPEFLAWARTNGKPTRARVTPGVRSATGRSAQPVTAGAIGFDTTVVDIAGAQ